MGENGKLAVAPSTHSFNVQSTTLVGISLLNPTHTGKVNLKTKKKITARARNPNNDWESDPILVQEIIYATTHPLTLFLKLTICVNPLPRSLLVGLWSVVA